MKNKIKETLEGFRSLTALVVGDVMLDRYWWGSVTRISPEAPVPVVELANSTIAAGGAANVATNIASLGAEPLLLGVRGDDQGGRELGEALRLQGVAADNLLTYSNRPTTIKTRIVAHQQHVVRIDHEQISDLSSEETAALSAEGSRLMMNARVLVLSDYAKGVLTPPLIKRLIDEARALGLPILVDPKGRDYARYAGATLLTPNRTEAALACGFDPRETNVVPRAGAELLRRFSIDSVLITEGEDGMTLFERDHAPVHLDASARQVYDVTGAGDTVIATLGVVLGAGADLPAAARIANVAAGIAVQQVGTTTVSLDQLTHELEAIG